MGRVWRVVAGSFDHTTKIWEVRSGRCIHTLTGHRGEISSCSFNCTKPPDFFRAEGLETFFERRLETLKPYLLSKFFELVLERSRRF